MHWIKVIYNLVEDLKTGEIYIYSYFYDIDKEKKAQIASNFVINNEIDYLILFNIRSSTANFIHKKNGTQKYFKDSVYKLSDILESKAYKNIIDDDRKTISSLFNISVLQKTLEKSPDSTLIYSRKNEDGSERRKKVKVFYLDETHEDIVIISRDITDLYEEEHHNQQILKQAVAEANRANLAKSEFLARVSHDLRTPMNGILGLTELSEKETDVNVLRKNIEKIQTSGKYLLNLINDTLDFQKIESGKMSINNQIYSSEKLLSSIVNLIKPSAEAKKIDFKIDNKNAKLNCFIKLDPVRTTQIFVNLLSNSIKFTPEGGKVTLEIDCLGRTGNISHNKIRVIDNGIGMSKDFIKNGIFKPFSQENNSLVENYIGSGLGLSIVYKLIQIMGGRIEVESTLKKGTTFTIFLDFERVETKDVKQINSDDSQKKLSWQNILSNKKILLIEDHPLNAEIAKMLLLKVDCIVQWEKNGKEGITAFNNSKINEFDAILMDIRMPIMDGLIATKNIRNLKRSDSQKIPIIAMSANAYDEDIQKSLQAGMNEHLAKPIESQKLYKVLAAFISKRNL